ncbi:MAG TPA: MBL fold metallo-hydrolase [Thermoanaerobaculia bacterium]|nr:MBL fold metallo-hydrolase [Thermoanaerobaculia bacterium]
MAPLKISMAREALRLPENVPGDFYVDRTCIDCDACRQIAPGTFRDHGGASSVGSQPIGDADVRRAMMALVACPTGSIGAPRSFSRRIGTEAFPDPVSENVYSCGFRAASSFGAESWLIRRPAAQGGNVLVDSPRFAPPLVRALERIGGVSVLFLTHRDDVADHARFAERFGCRRFLRSEDGGARLGVEEAWSGDAPLAIDPDLTAIPTPGHTRGHAVLLYRDTHLFTGDHLAGSPNRKRLTAFRDACWYSWREQIGSMKRLRDYRFSWVLPGHGRLHHAPEAEMRASLEECIRWMERTP